METWSYPKGQRNKTWSGTTQPLPVDEPRRPAKPKHQKRKRRKDRPRFQYASRRHGRHEGELIPAAHRIAGLPAVESWHTHTPPWLNEGEAIPPRPISPVGETQSGEPTGVAPEPARRPRLVLRRFRDVSFVDDDVMPRWYGLPETKPLAPKRQAVFAFAG